MAENISRVSGRSGAYKLDRGGAPTESGPFIGEVRNNNDPTRSGRVQVWIEDFAGPDKDNPDLWRTLNYVAPFYGTTQQFGTSSGEGSYIGNKQSYGMWFTPPDIGTQVICFFASGDPNQGYYTGCVVQPALNHMLPAVGASTKFKLDNSSQSSYFSKAKQLPVVEINDENQKIDEDPRFFDQPKPVHSVVAGEMLQQGLINDTIRGPIGSNSQRESPSNVFGVSSPGRAIWSGGLQDSDIKAKLEQDAVLPQDVTVVARRGGHSIVMDDGDLSGKDQLVRIRTAKGHQITMSDDGDCFYIIHANGQTWLEFGTQGTIDVYSSNSINLRSAGDINMHADRNININAGISLNLNGKRALQMESDSILMTGNKSMIQYAKSYLGIKSDGSLSLDSAKTGTWNGGDNLSLSAGCIALNSGAAPPVKAPPEIPKYRLPDVKFEQGQGWIVEQGKIDSICNRAPTHEPYPYHGKGVAATTELAATVSEEASPEIVERLDSEEVADTEFNNIDVADFSTEPVVEDALDTIAPEEVQGMAAQSAKNVDQAFDEISDDKGVGKYGFDAAQLEEAGYLKPGTVEFYLDDSEATLNDVLSSPSVWTGQDGVNNLATVLNDSNLQSKMQTNLYQTGLTSLKNAGVVTGKENPTQLGPLVQIAAKFGPEVTKSWINGTLTNPATLSSVNLLARSTQYAVGLVQQKLNTSVQGYSTGSVSTNTTSRGVIDQALDAVVGNKKVTLPKYGSSNETVGF